MRFESLGQQGLDRLLVFGVDSINRLFQPQRRLGALKHTGDAFRQESEIKTE
jgi:hypothetical protein